MQDLKCSKCPEEDHENTYFCRCEGRNIELAKQLRENGVNTFRKMNEYKVKDEYDFVEKYCNSVRPCIFWLPNDFDLDKVDEITSERGFIIMRPIKKEETICL